MHYLTAFSDEVQGKFSMLFRLAQGLFRANGVDGSVKQKTPPERGFYKESKII
jgi:hypothetical protein